MKSVGIVIPVYNAFEVACRCVETVLEYSPQDSKILILDDASPDGEFAERLSDTIKNDPRVSLHRMPVNGGYVKTANYGMRAFEERDVVLLNSDTEVAARWIEKLQKAAYCRPKVGSATPFTNKGLIAAFPRFCLPNELLPGYDLQQLNLFFERAAIGEYPELPSAVGHCTYYRRDMLSEVGYFDEENFGLGYGEENDLSCRAQSCGWSDVLDEATFIYHKENSSFGEKKRKLSEAHTKKLQEMYPHYFDRVSKFCSRDPIRPARMRVLDELVRDQNAAHKARVLHVVHNGPHEPKRDPLGGTELHVQDLIGLIDEVLHWSLMPLKTCYILTAHIPGAVREYVLPLGETSLERIFSRDHFDLIHLHHSRWLDHSELCAALQKHGNYAISFHDYILVCPRMHLYTPFHVACNRHQCNEKCGYRDNYISQYRADTAEVLEAASALIAFSDSTQALVEDALGQSFEFTKIPHGIHADLSLDLVSIAPKKPAADEPFKVAFLGYVPFHKGSLIIEKLIEHSQTTQGRPIEWHMFGKLFLETDKVIQHGEYERGDLQGLLSKVQPDLVMILSLCPETYCLTLDEAWSAGVPTLVTPLGAPPERVEQSGAGWIVNELSYESVWDQLQEIVHDVDDYLVKKERVKDAPITAIASEAKVVSSLYTDLVPQCQSSYDVLQEYLSKFGLLRAPKAAFHIRVLGKLASIAIYTLDSLKLRYYVQSFVTRILPRKFYQVLKSAR